MFRRHVPPSGPLRVMFVNPDLTVGGAEQHVATLAPALDPVRFAPSVVCINQGGPLFAGLAGSGVPAVAFDRPKGELLRGFLALMRHIRVMRPDVLVARGANAELLGRLAAALCRVPRSVVWVHNCGSVTPRRRSQRLADRVLDPFTSAYFGVAHGQVPYMTDDLGYPAAKIRVVHNGVDVDRYSYVPPAERDPALAAELGLEPGDLVVGIVAAIRREKDHPTFLRAAKLVLDREPRARFLVVGKGKIEQEIFTLADELGIADRVTFTGRRSDVPAVLAMLDVFTLTSTTIECFPMALLEAMAVGRAAVCTAIGGIPEMIADGVTGYLVQPRDAESLADRYLELLRDPALAEAMGKAARKRLETEFTLDQSVRNAELALEATAGRGPTHS